MKHPGNEAKPYRFAIKLVGSVILSVVIVVAVAFGWRVQQEREDRRSCDRSVAVREDGRAMWEWLFDRLGDSESEVVADARVELDRLLPHLRCDEANHPVRAELPGRAS